MRIPYTDALDFHQRELARQMLQAKSKLPPNPTAEAYAKVLGIEGFAAIRNIRALLG